MVTCHRLGWSLAVVFAAACGSQKIEPITSLVLVSDTDIPNVDQIRFEMRQQGKSAKQVTAKVSAEPLYLTLVHGSGALGPLEVTAVALAGSETLSSRQAIVSFVAGKTLTVPLFLSRRCVGPTAPSCTSTETCTETGCADKQLEQLAPWSGKVPYLGGANPGPDAGGDPDAGSADMDGGANGGGNGSANNGNGSNGDPDSGVCTANIDSDPNNCGGCGNVCKAAHGDPPECIAGECHYHCKSNWENCNQDIDPFDGCETRVGSATACGCGDRCDL